MKTTTPITHQCNSILENIQNHGKSVLNAMGLLQIQVQEMDDIDFTTEDPPLIERRQGDRRATDRRSCERRDTASWRSQIWKRTSLNQYCRRANDRRSGDRREANDRRLAMAIVE